MSKPPQSASRNPKRYPQKSQHLRVPQLPGGLRRSRTLDRTEREVGTYYQVLLSSWGRQHWWPAETPFEVIVGAYLTQNTAWSNVEKALANLRAAGVLSLNGVRAATVGKLEQLIRPAGYFRQKAARLKRFVAYLDSCYSGSLERMFARPTIELRAELLALNGVGPETADSILLYAGQHEAFVVDAYTRRIFERHGIASPQAKYDDIRLLVERALGSVATLETTKRGPACAVPPVHEPSAMSSVARTSLAQSYNEFHGLLVQVGKHLCQSREAKCHLCPLAPFLPRK